MDTCRMEARYYTRHHYNLSPAFQGEISGKTKSLYVCFTVLITEMPFRKILSYHIYVQNLTI